MRSGWIPNIPGWKWNWRKFEADQAMPVLLVRAKGLRRWDVQAV